MFLTSAYAMCKECGWEYDKKNALSVASSHNKKLNHEVIVDLTYTHFFRKEEKKKVRKKSEV